MHSIYKSHLLKDLCTAIPKAELHVHLEGTFELDLMTALAAKYNTLVPAPVLALKTPPPSAASSTFDLQTFFEAYISACSLIRDQEDFAQVLEAYLERAQKQGVRYAEVMIDVQNHMVRGVEFEQIFEGMRLGVRRHRERYTVRAIEVKFIASIVGEREVEEAYEVVEKAK